MDNRDRGLEVPNAKRDKRDAFCEGINEFDSNLGAALGHETRWTRFFKVLRRKDGSWLAILGTLNEDQEPIVFFGNGDSLMKAWQNCGRAMAADEWREDRYAD